VKQYYKECKTIKGINKYLATIGLHGWGIDEDGLNVYAGGKVDYYDCDTWIDNEQTKGALTSFYKTANGYEVFASKYTAKDIEEYEKEWGLN
jgi:hypothetical protein